MLHTSRCCLPLALAAAFAATVVHAESVVKGSVRIDHADWTAVDAMAYPDDDEIEVVFSDKAFDRDAILADGEVNSFDAMRHDGNTFTINLAADGPTMCVDMKTRAGDTTYSGSSCQSSFPETIVISTRSEARIAGSMEWSGDDGERISLTFDVPMLRAEGGKPAAAKGEPLPADGGEPGKAALAHFAALNAGDWETFKAISHPDRRSMMEQSEAAGEHMPLFEMLQAFAPRDLRIAGGNVDGDQANVEFEGQMDGNAVRGTAEVVRFEGHWYFAGSTMRD